MRVKYLTICLFLGYIFFPAEGANAQVKELSTRHTAAISEPNQGKPQRAADRFTGVRTLVLETLKKSGAASLSIAVAENGKILWEESFGSANKEKGQKATPQSLYSVASVSKSFTALGLFVLAEKGLIDLEKPANDYLGSAKLIAYSGDASQATIRRMLNMEAGLPMHWNLFPLDKAKPPEPDESIRRYGIIVNEPGQEYHYSNFAYGVLERIIARISDKDYAEFMKKEVFQPLGLDHTSVLVVPELAEQTVQNYDEKGNPIPALDYDHRGASAIYCSVHDLIRYGLFNLGNRAAGQKVLLRKHSLDQMHQPSTLRVMSENIGETHMASGWGVVDMAGYRFLVTSGSAPGTVARLTLIPKMNLAVAILINSSLVDEYDPWKIEWETFSVLIPRFPQRPDITPEKPKPFLPPAELLGEWEGSIKTYQGQLPAKLDIKGSQDVTLAVDGRSGGAINFPNPLGTLNFQDGFLTGLFFVTIPTDDTRRSPHVIYLRLKLQGDTLSGTATAVAVDRSFALPHWIQLKRAPIKN